MYRALRVGAVVTKSSGSDDPEVQRIFKEWNLDNQFPRKARLYCDLYDNFPELLEDCTFIEGKYKKYHDALGKKDLKRYVGGKTISDKLSNLLLLTSYPRIR